MGQKLDWSKANKPTTRRSNIETMVDDGKIYLADGTVLNARNEALKVERQCVRCGQLKNGHHFTTVPGRERRICAKCVHDDPNLDQNTSTKNGQARTGAGTGMRRLVARFESKCNGCNTKIDEGDMIGWDGISRQAFCQQCAGSLTLHRKR